MELQIDILGNKKTTLSVTKKEYVLDLKKLLQQKSKYPVEQQILVYQGQELNNDDLLINCLKIDEIPMIHLYFKLKGGNQIHIKSMKGKTLTLQLELDDKVEKIWELINAQPSILDGKPITDYLLMYKGVTLEDQYSLNKYGIEKEAVVNLIINSKKNKKEYGQYSQHDIKSQKGPLLDDKKQENQDLNPEQEKEPPCLKKICDYCNIF